MKWNGKRKGEGNPNWKGGISLNRKEYEKEYWIKNIEKRREKLNRWRRNNPIKDKEHLAKYRRTLKYRVSKRINDLKRRKRELPILVTKEELKELVERSKECYYCKMKIIKTFDIDHKIPLCRGGENKIENLVISCPTCNRRKGKMTADEFSKRH